MQAFIHKYTVYEIPSVFFNKIFKVIISDFVISECYMAKFLLVLFLKICFCKIILKHKIRQRILYIFCVKLLPY